VSFERDDVERGVHNLLQRLSSLAHSVDKQNRIALLRVATCNNDNRNNSNNIVNVVDGNDELRKLVVGLCEVRSELILHTIVVFLLKTLVFFAVILGFVGKFNVGIDASGRCTQQESIVATNNKTQYTQQHYQ
jgi:hypothetical protein